MKNHIENNESGSGIEIMSSEALRIVAIDDGYAQTKLVGDKDGGGVTLFKMRSSVRPGRYGLGTLGGTGGIGTYETEEGDQFTVSEDIEAENTQFDGFHTSTMNRVLVHHALLKGGFGGQPVLLVTGLPVSDYFFDDERDEKKIAAKTKNLMRGVTSTSGDGPTADVRKVKVGCQAVAAYMDYMLDDDLKEREDPTASIAVVDIGGRTTDVAVVVKGSGIDHARSGTENVGVLDVYNALSKVIRQEFGTRDKFPLEMMDAAVRTKKIELWGKRHDVSALVNAVIQEQEGKIAREVERRIGSAANLRSVVFVGGGGALYKDIAKRFPNGVMAENPEFSNARGLYKYIKYFGED